MKIVGAVADHVDPMADHKTAGHGENQAVDHAPNLQPGAPSLSPCPDQGRARAENGEDQR